MACFCFVYYKKTARAFCCFRSKSYRGNKIAYGKKAKFARNTWDRLLGHSCGESKDFCREDQFFFLYHYLSTHSITQDGRHVVLLYRRQRYRGSMITLLLQQVAASRKLQKDALKPFCFFHVVIFVLCIMRDGRLR